MAVCAGRVAYGRGSSGLGFDFLIRVCESAVQAEAPSDTNGGECVIEPAANGTVAEASGHFPGPYHSGSADVPPTM
jgi:hypothetical protein